MTKELAFIITAFVFSISFMSLKSIYDGKVKPKDMLEKETVSGCSGNCASCPSHPIERKVNDNESC